MKRHTYKQKLANFEVSIWSRGDHSKADSIKSLKSVSGINRVNENSNDCKHFGIQSWSFDDLLKYLIDKFGRCF